MNDGLILDQNLKMTSIVKLTEARVKKLKMSELETVIKELNEDEKHFLVSAIKEEKYEKIGNIVMMAVYRIMQRITFHEYAENNNENT